MGLDALAGAISGGVISGSLTIINNAAQARADKAERKASVAALAADAKKEMTRRAEMQPMEKKATASGGIQDVSGITSAEATQGVLLPTAETAGQGIVLPTAKDNMGQMNGIADTATLPTASESGVAISHSIQEIPGTQMQYVKADRQVIQGDDPVQWKKDVKNYIDTEIRKGKDVPVVAIDGDVLYITKDSSGKARFRNEITLPDGTKRVMTDEEFAVKLRAETHIDEVAQVSKRGSENVPDYKNHPFAKDGFNYRTAYFEDFDGSYYRLTLSVGINGEINTVYNVGKIKEARFPLSGSKAVRKNAGEHHASNDSIPQTASLSQENTGGNIFNGNVLPTAKEAQEQMQREQRAAEAETETERTGILLGVSDEVIREAVSVSKALDVDVVFYRRKGRRVKNDLGYYNHNDGKIYLNADIKNPASFILGHEMIHHIQLTEGYLKFADAVLQKIQQDGGDLNAMRKEIVDRYKENEVVLTSRAKVDQEVIAEYAQEHLFTNEADIISVVNADQETGHVIKRFLDNVLAKLGNKNARERAFVARARSLYAKALRENVGIQNQLYGRDTARVENAEAHTAGNQSANIAEDAGTNQTAESREVGDMTWVESAVSQNLRPEITENAELMQMLSDKFGADGTAALVRQIQAEVERTGTVGKFGVLFSDGDRAVEEALGANDDGRQYSIGKEKGVAKEGGKRYNRETHRTDKQPGVMWTLQKGVLTNDEVSAFYEKISEMRSQKYKNYVISADGDFIFEVGNKLIYTDGKYRKPYISCVVEIEAMGETDLTIARGIIYDCEQDGTGLEMAHSVVEAVLGEGTFKQSSRGDSGADEGAIGGRKREDGEATDSGSGENGRWAQEEKQYAITKDPVETETTTESGETTEGTDFWDEWLAKVEKYGAMPKGEKPARDIEVPKKIGKDKPVSQTVRTFQGTTARALT